ncbi:MAG: prepilin-type N-terminal cleavage/methylation domain-containing protein [Candidatus Magasanikiibacteriota bacterium]
MNKKGFTLIELLIVIAIIAIIAGVVFVALDPLTRFQDSRDSRRWGDITGVLSAVKINQVDNRGAYLDSIASTTIDTNYIIGTASSGCGSGCTAVSSTSACVDLTELVTRGYLASVPVDPSSGSADKTLYYLNRKSNGTLVVGACVPEHTPAGIFVAR